MDNNFQDIKPALTIRGGFGAFGRKAVLIGFTQAGILITCYDANELKEITKRLLQESKDKGESKLARLTVGMRAGSAYIQTAGSKTIAEALESNKENFLITKDSIKKIKISKSAETEDTQAFYSLTVKTDKEKYKFKLQISGNSEYEIIRICRNFYPGTIK